MTKVMGAVFVGIDVSACTLVVALERDHQPGRPLSLRIAEKQAIREKGKQLFDADPGPSTGPLPSVALG